MKILIVTTSIRCPRNLLHIGRAISNYRIKTNNDCMMLIVGDEGITERDLIQISAIQTMVDENTIKFLDIFDQNNLFSFNTDIQKIIERLIPTKSIQRRNIGFLYAMFHNYDKVISIDDDNFPRCESTWIEEFFELPEHTLHADPVWVDPVCIRTGVQSRGFPILEKKARTNSILETPFKEENPIVIVQGSIDGDPDRYALDRYISPDLYVTIKNDKKIAISSSNKMVFNTQNTMFDKQIFPAMFLFPMKVKIGNYTIDRMDDIFMSYIINEICHNQMLSISYGKSNVIQKRNGHNLEQDMFNETIGMCIAEQILKYVSLPARCQSVLDAYIELADSLYEGSTKKNDFVHQYIRSMSMDMLDWASVCMLLRKYNENNF